VQPLLLVPEMAALDQLHCACDSSGWWYPVLRSLDKRCSAARKKSYCWITALHSTLGAIC